MNRRFALIQAAISLVALAAVVWWASRQDAPELPSSGSAIAWLVAAAALYAAATVLRAERWRHILHLTRVETRRSDAYALTTVGYMGNNVLPARAGEALRVVLLSRKAEASKRQLAGTIVAERMLDAIALVVIFVFVVFAVLREDTLPSDRPLVVAGALVALAALALAALQFARRRGVLERVREWIRPIAHAPRALVRKEGVLLLGGTFVLWAFEASVYLAVARAVDLHISAMGALYLVALTNFFAALPAAPGSIGTFDAAVLFGVREGLGGAGSVAVSYLLMLRFMLYVPITVVGLIVLVTRYGGWSRLRDAVRLEASRA